MTNKISSAMILAAGYGKRLQPITENIPKPLVQIKNITLLENTINFFIDLKIKHIVINTHYKSELINKFIKNRKFNSKISLVYEEEILDTAGGVKNAKKYFKDDDILITNSDIFWKKENIPCVKKFLINAKKTQLCKLLLVSKEDAFGIYKKEGDFCLNTNLITRWRHGKKIIYYAGLQIINLNILNDYSEKKISFNIVWDNLISKKDLYGEILKSKLYHVGDEKGLKKVLNSIT
tara:strand:- start:240 stop:944 length:705 start_codon:yes stop_codon:yes gene_type:complete